MPDKEQTGIAYQFGPSTFVATKSINGEDFFTIIQDMGSGIWHRLGEHWVQDEMYGDKFKTLDEAHKTLVAWLEKEKYIQKPLHLRPEFVKRPGEALLQGLVDAFCEQSEISKDDITNFLHGDKMEKENLKKLAKTTGVDLKAWQQAQFKWLNWKDKQC